MSRYSSRDSYVDPQSGVLKNRFGITDQAALDQVEADIVAARSYELRQQPLSGNFDLPHLQAMHRYLFGDIYEWAGELRTVDVSKGNSRFAHHNFIRDAGNQIFQGLSREQCLAGLDLNAFSDRAGYYLGEINALHPFREGNGRAQREFISHLGYENGYVIEWQNITQDQVLQAAIRSYNGDSLQLAGLIRENTRPLEAEQQRPLELERDDDELER